MTMLAVGIALWVYILWVEIQDRREQKRWDKIFNPPRRPGAWRGYFTVNEIKQLQFPSLKGK